MEIELLDGDGRPLGPTGDDGPEAGSGTARSTPLVAAVVGVAAALAVLLIGGAVVGAVRGRMTDDLDRRLRATLEREAGALAARASPGTPSDADVAVQVLQSPGTVVSTTGPPADRPMVVELPAPGATRTDTTDLAVDGRAVAHRVAATTLATSAGVAGRTVVAAALPLDPVYDAAARVRATFVVLAVAVGAAAAFTTVRLRRRPS